MSKHHKPVVDEQEIGHLNAEARRRVGAGENAVEALASAARSRGYEEVARDASMVIYARGSSLANTPETEYVACWIDAPMSQRIEDGGLGFDGQTDLLDAAPL